MFLRAGKRIFAGKPVLKIILYRKGLTQGYSTYGGSGQWAPVFTYPFSHSSTNWLIHYFTLTLIYINLSDKWKNQQRGVAYQEPNFLVILARSIQSREKHIRYKLRARWWLWLVVIDALVDQSETLYEPVLGTSILRDKFAWPWLVVIYTPVNQSETLYEPVMGMSLLGNIFARILARKDFYARDEELLLAIWWIFSPFPLLLRQLHPYFLARLNSPGPPRFSPFCLTRFHPNATRIHEQRVVYVA